jgi:hypothetical protein
MLRMKVLRRAHLGTPAVTYSYRVFRRTLCRAAKPAAFLAVLMTFAPSAFTQTNFYPLLECKNRAYTNATIESVTPATVTIFWDGGGERIAITNLPPELLNRYHYDPQDAQAYLDAQAAKKTTAKERADQELAAIARARDSLGPAQKIRILKVISVWHLQIEAEGKVSDAYIHNLPPDFLSSLAEIDQAKVEVAQLEAQVAQEQNAASQPGPNTNPGSRNYRAQQAAANAQKNAAKTAHSAAAGDAAALAKARSRLKELESHTTISAGPTDYLTSWGVRQWEYQPTATPGLTSK